MAKINRDNNALLAALDIGSSKVACFIARQDDGGPLTVLGIGHHRSQGLHAGQVTDPGVLEKSVRAAVAAAEQEANSIVRGVIAGVNGPSLTSRVIEAVAPVEGEAIRDSDVKRVLFQARQSYELEARTAATTLGMSSLINCMPITYIVDGAEGAPNPRGMYGERLGVRLHMISVGSGPVRNLDALITRCHLKTVTRVASPYASALACAVDDEKDMGVTVIDMGAGSTSLSVFIKGYSVFAGALPVGGEHVTNDLAKGLATPIAQAERLKTIHGGALPSPTDNRTILKIAQVGEDEDVETRDVTRADLVRIIRPRIEETFEIIREHLSQAGLLEAAGRRMILTGGASQLAGVREVAERVLDKQVRLGLPRRLAGLPKRVSGPAFSTCVGLLKYAADHNVDHAQSLSRDNISRGQSSQASWFKQVWAWLSRHL